ncbi:MAG TPA: DUF1440 domain-containing protein [Trebonia sp.]|jgi:hypothetical protein|nr:DUF1440 domain-containing protein [Trebonia sp.]
MTTRTRGLTPLAAAVAGLAAGAVGTACMDTVRYLRYRRAGGTDNFMRWEFPPVETWDQAPDPGQVAKRLVEGFTQRPLPDRWAWLTSTVAHWAYGSTAAAGYGIIAGSLPRARPWHGLPFGAAVWASGYVVFPQAGLYKQIWEYDAKTLADDLSGHLAYGTGTGVAFWLLSKI